MANYRKSFNFRNGVQVDEDNFLVNANGLVGIGTSIPTETLDVIGTVRVVGVVTANSAFVSNLNVTGITTLRSVNIGIVSVTSGIVTASSGVVTYYGDGSGLVNIPTSQWIDVNPVGSGYSSIYAAGTVGIATNMPNYFLQVGNNPDTSTGIGINSTGDVKTTGIITATRFSGSGIGITQINASNIESGTLSNNRLPSNINVSGVVTATTFVGGFTGNLTGIAQSASSLTGTPNINVGVITASRIITDTIDVISSPSGITTVSTTLNVGVGGTGFTALNVGRIGVGTALPTSELQIRKNISTLLEVLSDGNQARISIGQSVGIGKSTALLRFGSTPRTFDIINNDIGNINMYLHNGPSGVGTGRFAWIYGQNNNELASLTYDGRFGIGITNPTSSLHVVGTSTVTGNANFGSNVTITGNLSAGSFSLPSLIEGTNISNNSGISTFYNLNVENNLSTNNIGVGTTAAITDIDARDKTALIGQIGIGTDNARAALDVFGVSLFDGVGIGTTNPSNVEYTGISVVDRTVGVHDTAVVIKNTSVVLDELTLVGIGTTVARSALDFADAGKAYPSESFLIPPRLTNAQRAGLSTVAGAFIFNVSTGKFQGYTGVAWTDFH